MHDRLFSGLLDQTPSLPGSLPGHMAGQAVGLRYIYPGFLHRS